MFQSSFLMFSFNCTKVLSSVTYKFVVTVVLSVKTIDTNKCYKTQLIPTPFGITSLK